jgi:hypothetical protein
MASVEGIIHGFGIWDDVGCGMSDVGYFDFAQYRYGG